MRGTQFGKAASALAALLLAGAIAGTANAATRDGKFAVELPGQAKCSRVLQAKDSNPAEYERFIGFVEGYLSAANRYEPNTFDLTPWHTTQALSLILAKHCATHPQELLGLTVQQLVIAMMPLRLATYSKLELVGDKEHHAEVYQAILKRAEEELKRRAFYNGPTDGTYTEDTKQALVAFQKSSGLDETGVPDTATLWVLLNP
jgi:hypothetical protein